MIYCKSFKMSNFVFLCIFFAKNKEKIMFFYQKIDKIYKIAHLKTFTIKHFFKFF